MKTSELIAELQKSDPTGELEVVAGGTPIYCVDRQPAYYDGPLKSLVIDESKKPYYSIVGFKVTNRGEKVKLHLMDLDDVICDEPEIPVDLSELDSAYFRELYTQRTEKYRANIRRIKAELDAKYPEKNQ